MNTFSAQDFEIGSYSIPCFFMWSKFNLMDYKNIFWTYLVPLSEDEIKMKTGCLLVSKAIILSNCKGVLKSINIQEIKGDFF